MCRQPRQGTGKRCRNLFEGEGRAGFQKRRLFSLFVAPACCLAFQARFWFLPPFPFHSPPATKSCKFKMVESMSSKVEASLLFFFSYFLPFIPAYCSTSDQMCTIYYCMLWGGSSQGDPRRQHPLFSINVFSSIFSACSISQRTCTRSTLQESKPRLAGGSVACATTRS